MGVGQIANYNLGSVTGEIRIDYDGKGTKEAQADVQALARQLEREKLALKLKADATELNRNLSTARADLERLSAMTATPEVQAEIAKAEANIIKIEAELAALGRKRVELQIDIDNSKLDGARKGFSAFFADVRRQTSDFGSDVRNTRSAVEGLGGVMSSLARPVFFASLASDAGLLVTALVPVIGAIGVLPGIALAAASAFAVVKIGTAGMGDAMKAAAEGDATKLAEAMKKLSPEAQNFVRSYVAIKPALDSLKLDVQNRLFQNLGNAMSLVAATVLPTVHTGLVQVAGGLNEMAHGVVEALTAPQTAGDLAQIFSDTAAFATNASSVIGDVVQIVLRLAGIGSQFLPAWGTGLANITQRFREWLLSAQGTQQVNQWIQQGLTVLGNLYDILSNIARIAVNIFKPLSSEAQSLLPTIVALTQAAADWTASAEGQKTIADVWTFLSVVGGQLMTVISTIAPILGNLVSWFSALPAPVQSVIGSFIGWSTVIGLILTKAAPLIAFFIQLGPLITKIPAAIELLSAAFTKVIGIFRTLMTVFAANPWVLLIIAVAALAYAIYSNWDAIWAYLQQIWANIVSYWQTTVSSFSSIGSTVWETIKSAWTASINGISTFFSSIWESMKAIWTSVTSFFSSTGSTVWSTISSIWTSTISALAAFFAPIWQSMQVIFQAFVQTILAIGSAVWDTLKTIWYAAILTIYALLTGQFGLIGQIWQTLISKILAIGSNLWNTISSIWSSAIGIISSNISSFISTVVSAVTGFVSRVVSYFTNLGSQIVSTVSNWASQAVSRVTSFASSIVATVSAFATSIPARIASMVASAISFFSNLASQGPSRIAQMASAIISAVSNMASQLVARISSGAAQAIAAFGRLASGALSALASLPGRMASLGGSIISGIISGISGAAGRLFSYLGNLASQALARAKAAFGIGSPSKLFKDEVGRWLPEGIAVGVEANTDSAAAAAKALAQKVTAGALDGLSSNQVGMIGSLVGAQTVDTSGLIAGASAASAAASSGAGRTLAVDNLNLNVQGIIDPTDPVSWRRFGEEVRDLIRDVEVSYK